MNKGRAVSKISEDVNEVFSSLKYLPSGHNLKKSKLVKGVKSSLCSKDSCDDISDSSSSADSEIDKLLEEITDVTENFDAKRICLDKKKKKKKLKKKSKQKKQKKVELINLSDSESEKKNNKRPISSVSSKDTEKLDHKYKKQRSCSRSRSRSRSGSYSKRTSLSSSRSNSKLYQSPKSRHRSQSGSSSESDLQRNQNKKFKRSSSRSLSPKFKETDKSKSTSRKVTEVLGDKQETKLASVDKTFKQETKLASVDKTFKQETKLASVDKTFPTQSKLLYNNSESSQFIPFFKKSESSDSQNSKENKTMSKGSDSSTIAASAGENFSNSNNCTDASQKVVDASDQGKIKDEGKNKQIVIKSLKDSTVLQQVEEAQNKFKNNENHNSEVKIEKSEYLDEKSLKSKETPTKEMPAPTKCDISKVDIKKGKEEPKEGEENLLTAFKKARNAAAEKDKKPVDKSRSRSRSRSKRSRSTSRTRDKYKKRSRSRDRFKKRSRSRDKYRKRSRSHSRPRRSASRGRYRGKRSRTRSRSGSRSRHNKNRRTKRTPSKERRKSPDGGDSLRDKSVRKRLLEVAKKNAVYLMKNNCLPPSIEKENVKATGKSVEELTDYCRKLVAKEYGDDDLSDHSLSPVENDNFDSSHHHPYAVKDSKPIMMNIRNAPMVPVKTNAERLVDASKLREQFPVSSGTDHRTVESEWVAVEKDEAKADVKVYPEVSPDVDITTLVSTRLNAMQRLQKNPTDRDAMAALNTAQKDMQNWALSKQTPGQFTGNTGVKLLTPDQLNSGYQPWARKDMFRCSKPVRSQFGLKMLQKMGWNPGEGLGKNRAGQVEPLVLDVKMDRRGLAGQSEAAPKKAGIPLLKSLSGKHPVTALLELCVKRKWDPPAFEVVFDSGPVHKKTIQMKVHVNNQTYKAVGAAPSKKLAKAYAAAVCLQALGVIQDEPARPIKSKETLHTTVPQPGVQEAEPAPEAVAPLQPPENWPLVGQPQEMFQGDQQAGMAQYVDDSSQDPMAQYAAQNAQVAQYGTDETQAAVAQYDADGNPIPQYATDVNQGITQYDAEGNPVITQYDADGNPVMMSQYDAEGNQVVSQYDADGNPLVTTQYDVAGNPVMVQYDAEGNQVVAQYGQDGTAEISQYGDGTQTMSQYSANDPNKLSHYGTDASHTSQYGNSHSNTAQYSNAQYGADGTISQYSADGTQYSSNNGTQAVSQYGSNAVNNGQFSNNDEHSASRYSQDAGQRYQTENAQGSHAQYNNDTQAYQQYSAGVQGYEQQQQQPQQDRQQQQQYEGNSRSGFSFPQPPRSLIQGFSDDNPNAGRGDSSNEGSTRNRGGRDARENAYGPNSYNNGQYGQSQYYSTSYQGSQY